MLQKLQNNPILSIIIMVVIMLGLSIDALPVSIMEARNFITAREMVIDGNWLLTTMNGTARYEKPPLPTWLTAISGLIFGIKNIVALRFPAIIFVIIIGVFTYKFSDKILENKIHSYYNALIVITSFYVIGIIIEAPWDIFTHGFMLIAIYYLFHFFESKNHQLKFSLLAACFIGFSILCKGPVSIYVLLLPFLIAYGVTYKYKLTKTKVLLIITILIMALAIGAWWYLFVRLNDAETFNAIAEKETGNWSSYNVRPFYYYWSFFIQSGIWTIPAFIGLLYPYLKTRVSNLKAYQFSILWVILAVILLSIIPEKKSRYLMPVLIPLAINTGFYIEYLIRNFKTITNKKETFPVYFNFGLIGIIGILFPLIGFAIGPFLTGIMLFWYILASILLVSIGVLMLINLKRKNLKNVFFLCVAFMVCALITLVPLSRIQSQADYNPISSLKNETGKQNISVYSFNYVSPEIIWDFGDIIPAIKDDNGNITLPEDDEFGLLAIGISPEDQAILIDNYSIKKMDTYDLNRASKDSKQYKDRLIANYYILTKK